MGGADLRDPTVHPLERRLGLPGVLPEVEDARLAGVDGAAKELPLEQDLRVVRGVGRRGGCARDVREVDRATHGLQLAGLRQAIAEGQQVHRLARGVQIHQRVEDRAVPQIVEGVGGDAEGHQSRQSLRRLLEDAAEGPALGLRGVRWELRLLLARSG